MDNAPIHKSTEVQELISQMWSKIKLNIRRGEVTEKDTLIPRISEAARKVTVSNCEGWIRHSISFFDRCLNMESML
ncbi:uncharacterized protein BX663DRAFT_437325 [Cokeromyces recurvatus]|uniref:uncharacterized protein n=1 Tax=Cokeromyces recurvatus TaxID=90255 RepID=UPI00221F51B0|nr:uncharacterized protein BX663DRAFT_437325 [Cokeromyces recurvatus]KAI7901545.1 hypothetical protein BX663DRAFT_437325 [Cokeromyces recurvatus]